MRKFFASFFSTIFLAFAIPSALLIHLNYFYLNPDFYISKVDILIQPLITEQITEALYKEQPDLKNYLSKSDIQKSLSDKLITTQYLKDSLNSLFLQIREYQTGDIINLSLIGIKENIPEFSEDISQKAVEKMEYCTLEELRDLEETQSELPECLPPGSSKSEIQNEISSSLNSDMLAYIPAKIELPAEETAQFALLVQKLLKNSKAIYYIISSILILLLIIIALIIFQPARLVLKWLGSTILISAVDFLILATALKYVINLIIEKSVIPNQTVSKIILFSANLLQKDFFLFSAVLGALSIIIFLPMLVIKSNNQENIT